MAVTVAGVVVGNFKNPVAEELRAFKDRLTVMFVGLLFVLLVADVSLNDVFALGNAGLTPPFPFTVSRIPELLESEPNESLVAAGEPSIPGLVTYNPVPGGTTCPNRTGSSSSAGASSAC